MEYDQIAKQVIDFQKISIDNWFSTVALVQDQAASAVGKMLDQTGWMPAEGRKAIQSWMSACTGERDRLKSYVDESFAGANKLLAKPRKTSPAAAKPKATKTQE
jgi:hypothetical protein